MGVGGLQQTEHRGVPDNVGQGATHGVVHQVEQLLGAVVGEADDSPIVQAKDALAHAVQQGVEAVPLLAEGLQGLLAPFGQSA